jgi:hypothetical protein
MTAMTAGAAAMLRRVWRDVLRVDRVALEDDFFDLGGDSILLLDMLARAGDAGVELPLDRLGDFLEEPTCLHLLELTGLSAAAGAGPSHGDETDVTTISLRAASGDANVFVLLPSMHDVWAVRELSARVGTAAIHVLLPAWSTSRPFVGVPALGDRMAATMRSIQPAGPYRIVGSCTAGLAAAEAASRLAGAGHDVPLLALVNTDAPGLAAPAPLDGLMPGIPTSRPGEVSLLTKLRWLDQARAELGLPPDDVMLHLWAAVSGHIGELLQFLVGDRPERWDDAYRERAARALMATLDYQVASEAHDAPAPYAGLVNLLYSRQFTGERRDSAVAAEAWSARTGCRCEVEVLDDVHSSALVAHAAVAGVVSRSLAPAPAA